MANPKHWCIFNTLGSSSICCRHYKIGGEHCDGGMKKQFQLRNTLWKHFNRWCHQCKLNLCIIKLKCSEGSKARFVSEISYCLINKSAFTVTIAQILCLENTQRLWKTSLSMCYHKWFHIIFLVYRITK